MLSLKILPRVLSIKGKPLKWKYMWLLFQLNELTEAEDALSEANILNNSDPEVWGYLSLVCLKTGRQLEAEQAYKYSIKVRLFL